MTFIKLDRRYVNVHMITDVFVHDRRPDESEVHAEIYLSAPMGERSVSNAPLDVSTRHVHVSGDEARRIIDFMDEHLVGA